MKNPKTSALASYAADQTSLSPSLPPGTMERLVDHSPVGLGFVDLDFRFRYVNPKLAVMNGRCPEDHLNRRIDEILPEHAKIILPKFENIIRTQKPILDWEVETVSPVDLNTKCTYLVSYFPLFEQSGRLTGIGISVSDVTIQRNVELETADLRTAIHTEKSITEAVCDQMPAGVVIVQVPSGKIIYRNRAFDDVLGHFSEALNIEAYTNYSGFHPDGRPYAPEDYPTAQAVLFGKTIVGEEMLYHRPDGEIRHLSVSSAPIINSLGQTTNAVTVFYDISEKRRFLETLEDEIKLREHFVNALTHDLRGPLSAAKISTELVLRYPEKTETHARFLQKSVEALARCDRMIGDLLDAHRIKAGQRLPLRIEECNAVRIVESIRDEQSLIYGRAIDLNVEQPLVHGYWSSEGLRRIVENLVTNAIKYGDLDKPISVKVCSREARLEISVHNWGDAISKDDQLILFEMFQRTASAQKSKQMGWGIGLTLVKALAEAHGGNVTVESEAAVGTIFTVNLPLDSRSQIPETPL